MHRVLRLREPIDPLAKALILPLLSAEKHGSRHHQHFGAGEVGEEHTL